MRRLPLLASVSYGTIMNVKALDFIDVAIEWVVWRKAMLHPVVAFPRRDANVMMRDACRRNYCVPEQLIVIDEDVR